MSYSSMTNLQRLEAAKHSCLSAAELLESAQAKDSEIWIHSRVASALVLVRNANAALESLSQDLLTGTKTN